MITSELSLEVSETTNTKVMRLFDTSHYCGSEVITNYLIEVMPVNKTGWVTFNVPKDFSLVLNSSNLRYKKANDNAGLIALPDGIYEIRQSFKPNIYTLVHFYHLRITDISNKIRREKKKLLGKECKISRQEYISNRDKLRDIEEFVLAAKWEVEECHDKKKGKELYEFANKLLEQYSNECQC